MHTCRARAHGRHTHTRTETRTTQQQAQHQPSKQRNTSVRKLPLPAATSRGSPSKYGTLPSTACRRVEGTHRNRTQDANVPRPENRTRTSHPSQNFKLLPHQPAAMHSNANPPHARRREPIHASSPEHPNPPGGTHTRTKHSQAQQRKQNSSTTHRPQARTATIVRSNG